VFYLFLNLEFVIDLRQTATV